MSFHLGSSLSFETIRTDFASQGFAHISNVLPLENAKRMHKGMVERTPWNLVFTDRGKHIDLPGAQLASMPKDSARQLQQAICAQARDSFQYCYNNYPIHDARKAGLHDGLNILAVPQKHNVSLVAPFAGGMRLSISGWFRSGEPE